MLCNIFNFKARTKKILKATAASLAAMFLMYAASNTDIPSTNKDDQNQCFASQDVSKEIQCALDKGNTELANKIVAESINAGNRTIGVISVDPSSLPKGSVLRFDELSIKRFSVRDYSQNKNAVTIVGGTYDIVIPNNIPML